MTKSVDEIRELLRSECDKFGSQKAWAQAHKFSPGYICDVLKGNRDIGPTLAKCLGYEQQVIYVKRHLVYRELP